MIANASGIRSGAAYAGLNQVLTGSMAAEFASLSFLAIKWSSSQLENGAHSLQTNNSPFKQ
jgi:hypothetical protein